jgi:hypothetical protein
MIPLIQVDFKNSTSNETTRRVSLSLTRIKHCVETDRNEDPEMTLGVESISRIEKHRLGSFLTYVCVLKHFTNFGAAIPIKECRNAY